MHMHKASAEKHAPREVRAEGWVTRCAANPAPRQRVKGVLQLPEQERKTLNCAQDGGAAAQWLRRCPRATQYRC